MRTYGSLGAGLFVCRVGEIKLGRYTTKDDSLVVLKIVTMSDILQAELGRLVKGRSIG